DADADPTNELINDAVYNPETHSIDIQEGVDNTVIISLDEFPIEDADSDPMNEAITGFNLMGNNLHIEEVNTHTVSLARFKVDSVSLGSDNIFSLYEGGTVYSVDLDGLG